MKIYNVNDIDLNEIVFSQPKANVMGGQSVYLSMPNDDKIIVQTPKVQLPYGISTFNNRHSVNFVFGSATPTTKRFVDFLQKFDDLSVSRACVESSNWFGKKIDKTIIKDLYNSQLKHTKDGDGMRAKLIMKNNEFVGDVFDFNKQPITIQAVQPGSTVQAIIECVGMYFINKEFGITWKVVQLKLQPNNKITGYSFVDDEPEHDEAEPA